MFLIIRSTIIGSSLKNKAAARTVDKKYLKPLVLIKNNNYRNVPQNTFYQLAITEFKIFIWGGISSDLVLRRRASGAVKRDFRLQTYIRRYRPQMKILNMVVPILMRFNSLVPY